MTEDLHNRGCESSIRAALELVGDAYTAREFRGRKDPDAVRSRCPYLANKLSARGSQQIGVESALCTAHHFRMPDHRLHDPARGSRNFWIEFGWVYQTRKGDSE